MAEETPHDADMEARAQQMIRERLMALGHLIEVSAFMEMWLRSAFCALVGSKFAAVVAGGQSADWLIGQCKALVDVHWEMPEEVRQALKDALALCDAANKRRNVLVHSVKTASRASDGTLWTIRSRLRSHTPVREPWTPVKINEVVIEIATAFGRLGAALEQAVSPEVMVLDEALAWEERQRREGST